MAHGHGMEGIQETFVFEVLLLCFKQGASQLLITHVDVQAHAKTCDNVIC